MFLSKKFYMSPFNLFPVNNLYFSLKYNFVKYYNFIVCTQRISMAYLLWACGKKDWY
jgi:hypothetical protein